MSAFKSQQYHVEPEPLSEWIVKYHVEPLSEWMYTWMRTFIVQTVIEFPSILECYLGNTWDATWVILGMLPG